MLSLNPENNDFLASATPWNGTESNPSPDLPWEGIRTLNSTSLGALNPLDSLRKWQGIRNPVAPLTTEFANVSMQLLDTSTSPVSNISTLKTNPNIHTAHPTLQ